MLTGHTYFKPAEWKKNVFNFKVIDKSLRWKVLEYLALLLSARRITQFLQFIGRQIEHELIPLSIVNRQLLCKKDQQEGQKVLPV